MTSFTTLQKPTLFSTYRESSIISSYARHCHVSSHLSLPATTTRSSALVKHTGILNEKKPRPRSIFPPKAFHLMNIWLGESLLGIIPIGVILCFSNGYGLDYQKLSHDFMIGIEMKLVLRLAEDAMWPGGRSLSNSYCFLFCIESTLSYNVIFGIDKVLLILLITLISTRGQIPSDL